jgi:hypothetical protein
LEGQVRFGRAGCWGKSLMLASVEWGALRWIEAGFPLPIRFKKCIGDFAANDPDAQ